MNFDHHESNVNEREARNPHGYAICNTSFAARAQMTSQEHFCSFLLMLPASGCFHGVVVFLLSVFELHNLKGRGMRMRIPVSCPYIEL